MPLENNTTVHPLFAYGVAPRHLHGSNCLLYLLAQFYLPLLPAHLQNHELPVSGEPPAVSYRRRACSYRQQFVAYPCSRDAAAQTLPASYQPIMIQALSARASPCPPLLKSVPAKFPVAPGCPSRDLSCPCLLSSWKQNTDAAAVAHVIVTTANHIAAAVAVTARVPASVCSPLLSYPQ